MKYLKKIILSIFCFTIITAVFFYTQPAYARMVRGVEIELSEQERIRYQTILEKCGIPNIKSNIRQLYGLEQTALAAGLEPSFLFRDSLPDLARAGILNADNLSKIGNQLIELEKEALAAGLELSNDVLPNLARLGIVNADNLSEIVSQLIELRDLLTLGLIYLAKVGVVNADNLSEIGSQLIGLGKETLAAGLEPSFLFKNSLPDLAKAGIVNADNLSKIGNQIIELDKTALKAGLNPDSLFNDLLLVMANKGVINAENLSKIGNQIIELYKTALEAGLDPYFLFEHSLPDLANKGVVNADNFSEIGKQIIKLGKEAFEAGFEVYYFFKDSLYDFIRSGVINAENLSKIGNQIIELYKTALEAGLDPNFLFNNLLSILANKGVVNADNLNEIGSQIIEVGKVALEVGLNAQGLFSYSLPHLARAGVVNADNVSEIGSQIIELGKGALAVQANAYIVFESLVNLVHKNIGFSFSDFIGEGRFSEIFLRFMRRSGRYFEANRAFLNILTPENIESEIENILEYFNYLDRPIYLPTLYAEYKRLPQDRFEELLDKFKRYCEEQESGVIKQDPGLSDSLKEEADFYIIGSTNLSWEGYRRVLENFRGQDIPRPNFGADFTLDLNLGDITGQLSATEVAYLGARISWLKDIVERSTESYLAETFAQYYSRFLVNYNETLPANASNLSKIIENLSSDNKIEEGIASRDVKDIQARCEELLMEMDFEKDQALLELFDLFSHGQGSPLPKVGMLRELIKVKLKSLYISNNFIREHMNSVIGSKESLGSLSSSQQYTLINQFIEILTEIKPQAVGELQERINQAVELAQIKELLHSFHTEEGKGVEKIRVVASKTELDYFYGYFGENCTADHPEELLNPNFTPLRIITDRGIEGAIYTLSYEIEGKKSLIIVGLEPQEGLVARTNPEEFTKQLLGTMVEIARQNGYEQVLVATNTAAQSNRPQIRGEIQRLIGDRRIITQDVQENFPGRTRYDIRQVAVYWERRER